MLATGGIDAALYAFPRLYEWASLEGIWRLSAKYQPAYIASIMKWAAWRKPRQKKPTYGRRHASISAAT